MDETDPVSSAEIFQVRQQLAIMLGIFDQRVRLLGAIEFYDEALHVEGLRPRCECGGGHL